MSATATTSPRERVSAWARARALPRAVHPGAWWLWGLGLMVAATRTTHPLALALLATAAAVVVHERKTDAPWSRAFSWALRLSVILIVVRTLFQVTVAPALGTQVVLTLPRAPLPDWVLGLRLGGQVTQESLVVGVTEGMRLAVIVLATAAATSLASPTRLLRALPAALYEVAVAAVVALTFLPTLVADLQRVVASRRLRGRPIVGVRAWGHMAAAVLDSALDRSLTLAATMDSRGHGRRSTGSASITRASQVLLLTGLVGIGLGLAGLMDSAANRTVTMAIAAAGIALAVGGLAVAGRTQPRTRHRRDPWQHPEWVTASSGVAVAVSFIAVPPMWPTVPAITVIAALAACLPAFLTPRPATQTVGVIS